MARKNQKAPWEEEEEIIWVSKTEMKNDMTALQKLGEELVGLKSSQLSKIPMPEDLLLAIKDAQRFAQKEGRHLAFVGYVCGTSQDFQGLESAESRLKDSGVLVAKTNAHAALIAAELVQGGKR